MVDIFLFLVRDSEAHTLVTVAKKKANRQARAFNPKGLPFVTQPEPADSESASRRVMDAFARQLASFVG